jgi:hypothetical protein
MNCLRPAAGAAAWHPTLDEFITRWKRAAQGLPQYAIMRHTMYQHLQQSQLPMKVIGSSERVVVASGL